MTQDTSVPGIPEPGPDTFNFDDYLEGKATFPTFEHTAYLDQESGARLGAVMAELEALVSQQEETEKRIKARSSEAGNSFVDTLMDQLLEEREELDVSIKAALAERDELNKKIVSSGLTLVFQVKTAEELGTVTREANRQFRKENPQFKNADENDLDYLTARTRYTITAQIAHFCVNMKVPGRDEPVPPPTRKQADSLLLKLISSELMRLMDTVGTGLSASQDWADKIDAGFPGGSPDMEDLSLDSVPAENRESLEGPPADDAHRRGDGLAG